MYQEETIVYHVLFSARKKKKKRQLIICKFDYILHESQKIILRSDFFQWHIMWEKHRHETPFDRYMSLEWVQFFAFMLEENLTLSFFLMLFLQMSRSLIFKPDGCSV